MRIPFIQDEKDYIHKHYATTPNAEIAKKLHRSEGVIRCFASSHGLRKNPKVSVGQKFGKLTVVKQALHKGNDKSWECLCECGNKMTATTGTLHSGHSKTCGCGRIEAISNNYGLISGSWYGQTKRNAESRNFVFDLPQEFLDQLLKSQESQCAISGLPIFIKFGRQNTETTASLDRIDNTKGYTEDNVWFVHKHVNYMKWTHDIDYFLQLCKTISTHQDTHNGNTG